MFKTYKAPKPKFSSWEWFKFIAIRTIFPPILLWDLITLRTNKLLGAWVGRLVLPAQNKVSDNFQVESFILNYNSGNGYNEKELAIEWHKIITHDDANLDTIEITHKSQELIETQYKKYIINFPGNNSLYQNMFHQMEDDARALKANVVGFNFRGVAKSTSRATSTEDLVTDGIAQVQRLLDQGVSPQNITLKGHSLGAGIATLVAHHFHKLGQPINLFNGRSFSSITNFLVGTIRLLYPQGGDKESIRGIILGWLAYPFCKLALALTKWEINAGSAFKSIPEAYRDYIVVRSRKEIRVGNNCIDDDVIPHYASIHKELTSERRKKKAAIDKEIEKIDKSGSPDKAELAKKREILVQAKKKIKRSDNKMETAPDEEYGHNLNLDLLHNRSGKSAQAFFIEFVQRIEKDHAVKSVSIPAH